MGHITWRHLPLSGCHSTILPRTSSSALLKGDRAIDSPSNSLLYETPYARFQNLIYTLCAFPFRDIVCCMNSNAPRIANLTRVVNTRRSLSSTSTLLNSSRSSFPSLSWSPWYSSRSSRPCQRSTDRRTHLSRSKRSFHSHIIARYPVSVMAASGTNIDLGLGDGKEASERLVAGEGT